MTIPGEDPNEPSTFESLLTAFRVRGERLKEALSEVEVLARDSGLYRGTLFDSAKQLGCDEHMVDHAVKDLLAERDKLRLASQRLLDLRASQYWFPRDDGGRVEDACRTLRAALARKPQDDAADGGGE